MARKQNPQPLDISSAGNDHGTVDNGSKTSLSLKLPKSPRSPIRFSTKFGGSGQHLQSFGEHPSMQAGDQQEHHRNTLCSPTTESFQSFHAPASAGQGGYEQERPATASTKSGFFSNYMASKSANRLQSSDTSRSVSEGRMSRDSDRPSMPGKTSASEAKRNGKTSKVSFCSRVGLRLTVDPQVRKQVYWTSPSLGDQLVVPPDQGPFLLFHPWIQELAARMPRQQTH
jgi:hypothetical protein